MPAWLDEPPLAFLYGDVGLSQPLIAKLVGMSRGVVSRAVKEGGLKPLVPKFGEWNREAAMRFPSTLPPTLSHPDDVPSEQLWVEIRKALRRQVPTLIGAGPTELRKLRSFLRGLPYILGAARARLTEGRLKLLHGNLGFERADLAVTFDAPLATVAHAIDAFHIEKNREYFHLFDGGLVRLADALGVDEWSVDNAKGDSAWRIHRKQVFAARAELRRLGLRGDLDWGRLDAFVAFEGERTELLERVMKRVMKRAMNASAAKPARSVVPSATARRNGN